MRKCVFVILFVLFILFILFILFVLFVLFVLFILVERKVEREAVLVRELFIQLVFSVRQAKREATR